MFLQFFYSNPILQSYLGNGSSSPFVHFVSGGLAGITAASATYPLDLVRTRLAAQVWKLYSSFDVSSVSFVCPWPKCVKFVPLQRNTMYYQGIGHAFRTICREEGLLGLYKGLGATMLVSFPLFSCVIC